MPSNSSTTTSPQPRLLERLSQVIRLRHYSYRTEQAYAFRVVASE